MPANPLLAIEWRRAGYESRMGSDIAVPPAPPGFVRGYYLTSADHAINNISLGRLKVARFVDLNDPFELLALNFRERAIRKIVRDFKSTYDAHTGLLCFSSDWTNPVLWSHYGSKHSGICLGFDLAKNLVQEVLYQDDRLLAEIGDEGTPAGLDQALQDLLLRTKFRHWEYEREIRRFIALESGMREGALHFYPFDSTLQLREVILGPQCKLPLDGVRDLVTARHHRAATFSARLAFKSFTVVPDERTIP